jgi:hypothetical protein
MRGTSCRNNDKEYGSPGASGTCAETVLRRRAVPPTEGPGTCLGLGAQFMRFPRARSCVWQRMQLQPQPQLVAIQGEGHVLVSLFAPFPFHCP